MGSRYAHVTWQQVVPLVERASGASHLEVVARVKEVLGALGSPWTAWRASVIGAAAAPAVTPAPDPFETAMSAARETAADHVQRAPELDLNDLEAVQELRLPVRDALADHDDTALRHVRPWIWQPESQGTPLSSMGREHGYELRLSWYRSSRTS